MPQSYTNLLYHMIFSTKDREPFLDASTRPDLFAYVGGICRNINGSLLSAGGYDDHVHLLVKLHAETSVAEAMRTIKANSSRWMHRDKGVEPFAWQTGYSAFTASESIVPQLRGYLAKQEEHHKRVGYFDELDAFLKKNGITRVVSESD